MISFPKHDELRMPDARLHDSTCQRESTIKLRAQATEQAIYIMRKHYHESLTIQEVASAANLSPYHFNRVFHNATGVTPGVFLAALRLEQAKKLLLTTNRSITSICFDVGYQSLGTFTTRFTQFVGINPTRLRVLAQEDIMSVQIQALRDEITCWLKHRQQMERDVSVFGRVHTTVPFSGLTFVGMFSDPLPQGAPVSCTLLTNQTHYQLPAVPDGTYYLFAAALRWTDDFKTTLTRGAYLHGRFGRQALKIRHNHIIECQPITLYRSDWTDPPILIALPWLINQKLRISGQAAGRE